MNCTNCQMPYDDIPVQNILGTPNQNKASIMMPNQIPVHQSDQMPTFTQQRLAALTQELPGASTSPAGPFGTTADQLAPITPTTQPPAMTLESTQFLNGALRTQLGQKVTVDFLIGTGTLVDKTGTLLAVGANYIIINELETDDILFCDFFTIKFIRVYH